MNKVLIIDDDEELCDLVSEYLTVEGFETTAVHDGETGLTRGLSGEFDLAILDVMLPKINGFDVLKNLREKSGMPVLTLTARGLTASYLNQPIETESLRPRLRHATGSAGYPQILLRMGRASEAPEPTARRDLEDVILRDPA